MIFFSPMGMIDMNDVQYPTVYYETLHPGSARSARAVVHTLVEWLAPQSVIDVGCGAGAWAAAFLDQDVTTVHGVDAPWLPREILQFPTSDFIAHDLRTPLTLNRSYDLVLSLEVAEHLPEAHAATFVESLVQLGSVIVFSAAIPRQGGHDHQNEQWPAYWAHLFAEHDYVAVDALRLPFWHDDAVEWWYAQNMIVYMTRTAQAAYADARLPVDASSADPLPALVHPTHAMHLHSEIDTLHKEMQTLQDHLTAQEAVEARLSNRVNELATWGKQLEEEVDALEQLTPGTVSLAQVLRALPRLIAHAVRRRWP